MMNTIRLYIVGAGFAARCYAAGAGKLPGPVDLHVAGRSPERLLSFAGQFPGATTYASVEAMLAVPARPDDIVVIATPPGSHREPAVQALQSGRHVLCEKPLALTLDNARAMLDAARASGRRLGCCSGRHLGTPVMRAVVGLIRDGSLGRLYHARSINRRQRNRAGIDDDPDVAWFRDPAGAGGGVLMDMAPYDFTTLNEVLQPVEVEVRHCWMVDSALGTASALEQHAGASLVYRGADGTRLPVTYERAGFTHGRTEETAEIEGSRGAVRWRWFSYEGEGTLTFSTDVEGKVESRTSAPGFGPLNEYERPLVHFHDLVCGRPSPAVVDARAVFNFACVRALYDAAATGRPQVVRLADFA